MVTPVPAIRTDSTGSMVVGIAIGFVLASAFVLSLRLYTRVVLLRISGMDDWTVLLAMVFSIIVSAATCLEVNYGMGRHAETVTPQEMVEQSKFLLVVIIHYNVGMNIMKISFLCQYRRVFISNAVQRVCFWAMVYVISWACVQAVLLGVSCLPIAVIIPSAAGFCLDTLPIWYFSSGMSMATDIMIFCIPLPSVFKLNLPNKQKAMLLGVFSLGFFVCIISVYRLFTLRTAVYSEDPPWDNTGAAIWSVIELNTSIIAASLPTIRPALAKWMPGVGLSSARDENDAYPSYGTSSGVNRGNVRSLRGNQREVGTEEIALKDMLAYKPRGSSSLGSRGTGSSRSGRNTPRPQRNDTTAKKGNGVRSEQ